MKHIKTINEINRSQVSGTKSGWTDSLEDSKYELKKYVKGARIGNFTNVLLPKGTIIYNLPGGVFADHFSLKNKYASRSSQGPRYFDKPTFKGIMIKQTPALLSYIEKNSKVLESVTEANRGKVFKAARKGSYPAVIVVVQDGKVIHQEPVSTPDIAPATFNVMQEKYPKALLHLEDKTGKRLFSESVNEAEKAEGDRSKMSAEIEKALKDKATESGVPIGLLRLVMRRGLDAWNSSHRAGIPQVAWGYARVNAFLEKGKGTWGKADADIAKEVRDEGKAGKLPIKNPSEFTKKEREA